MIIIQIILTIILSPIWYINNIINLVSECDFNIDTPKCEIVRTVGIFAPPVGAIVGYPGMGKYLGK